MAAEQMGLSSKIYTANIDRIAKIADMCSTFIEKHKKIGGDDNIKYAIISCPEEIL